jgi:phenylacetate-CoA ligase
MLIRGLCFNLKQWVGNRPALHLHGELMAEERLSADELEALVWRKRRALVRHAWQNVPHYNEKYTSAGLHPDDLRYPEDFQHLPVLEKDELRNHFDELIARDRPRSQGRLSTTGGSTGVPVRVLFDRRSKLEAFSWRLLDWWGLKPHEDAAYAYRRTRTACAQALNHAKWWPTRRLFLDASLMTPEHLDHFLGRLWRVRPPLLQGYNGALADLATALESRGLKPDFLRAVWSTAAPLPLPLRRRMEQLFGCPVYDQYGCGEVFWLAADCAAQNGMHIFHSRRNVEAVGPEGLPCPAGEWGEVLITDLDNWIFPILRYRNGDRGRLLTGDCSCGLNLPRMDSVKGRISDSLRLAGGVTLSGEFLTTIFDLHPEAVKAFQVHQARDGSLTLRCVPGDDARADRHMQEVAEGLRTRVGAGTEIRLEQVARLGHDQGKTRFIISDLHPGRED